MQLIRQHAHREGCPWRVRSCCRPSQTGTASRRGRAAYRCKRRRVGARNATTHQRGSQLDSACWKHLVAHLQPSVGSQRGSNPQFCTVCKGAQGLLQRLVGSQTGECDVRSAWRTLVCTLVPLSSSSRKTSSWPGTCRPTAGSRAALRAEMTIDRSASAFMVSTRLKGRRKHVDVSEAAGCLFLTPRSI